MTAWLWSIWRPHRRFLFAILALSAANAWVVARLPLAISDVYARLEAHAAWTAVERAIALLAALGVLRFALYCGLQSLRAWVNTRLEAHVRDRVFSHLLRCGPGLYGRFSRGDLLTRLVDDAGYDKLCWLLCTGSLRVVEAVLVIVGVGWAMASISVQLTLACLLPIPLLFAVTQTACRRLDPRFEGLQDAISRVTVALDGAFSAMRMVKAYTMEWRLRGQYGTRVRQRQDAELEVARARALIENLYGLIVQLAAIMAVLAGGRMVVEGSLSLADFIAFNGFAVSITMPLGDLGGFLARVKLALVCTARIRDLELCPPDVADGAGTSATEHAPPAALRSVRFAYGEVPVLDGLSLDIAPAELVAVTGRVGAGKSTLLRLLMRQFDPDQGQVLRDGVDLRAVPLAQARASLGWVPQAAVVLSGTVADNVRFGRDLTPEAVRGALRAAQLEDEIDALPDGLDTRLGAGGIRLSGGQQQRLAIARAIAGHPRLLLLDNATSALDAVTDARLWPALRAALPGTAIVAASHSDACLRLAHRVFTLEGARLFEQAAGQDCTRSA